MADSNGVAMVPSVEAGVVNALQHECGETSQAHGFKDDWLAAKWVEALADYMSKEERWTNDTSYFPHLLENPGDEPPFGAERIATPDALRMVAAMLRNNFLGMKIALIHSELSEALESLRHNGGAQGALDGEGNFGEEMADAIVRILDTGTFTKDNLGDQLLHKMAVNAKRPHMHGGKVF